ncbi:unnamed protein product, partial [Ectocarpus sp. 12 AP-2014]
MLFRELVFRTFVVYHVFFRAQNCCGSDLLNIEHGGGGDHTRHGRSHCSNTKTAMRIVDHGFKWCCHILRSFYHSLYIKFFVVGQVLHTYRVLSLFRETANNTAGNVGIEEKWKRSVEQQLIDV